MIQLGRNLNDGKKFEKEFRDSIREINHKLQIDSERMLWRMQGLKMTVTSQKRLQFHLIKTIQN